MNRAPALGSIRFIELSGGSLTFRDEDFAPVSSSGGPLELEVLPPP